ncbi:MAG: SUMF1/EgtB/PvdO family nonheme iron enzyme [Deltaproteobacteria bacterium]|nr:SUMF1/EgtB/PvdO family nonheme iron enzyme [Deltaproteobacteria bacterium]MBW2254261.1 SUMF1/EgtB/PvdO family nonheme iron enzyme [Deltaproteobacteria bacterium]
MIGEKPMDVSAALGLPPDQRLALLVRIGRAVTDEESNGIPDAEHALLVKALVSLLEEGHGEAHTRLEIGEVLGLLGDPRLSTPADADYWAHVDLPPQVGSAVQIGRFPVTNAEFQHFVDEGGYDDASLWTDAGWAWLKGVDDPWPLRAAAASSGPFVVPNQPVVGVTWYEASAYAAKHASRLPRFDERLWVVRGEERRPYPWGSPFGAGNANTREEVLRRPCAVGLFVNDCTPEGVRDLAGNVAEWNLDGVGDQRWIHPGAWDQPSMAAWAKARFLETPESRWAGLGFRLARD